MSSASWASPNFCLPIRRLCSTSALPPGNRDNFLVLSHGCNIPIAQALLPHPVHGARPRSFALGLVRGRHPPVVGAVRGSGPRTALPQIVAAAGGEEVEPQAEHGQRIGREIARLETG